jgi:uncharacterized protein
MLTNTAKMTAVPSPCISLCQMDKATGLCKGCWRTIEEIIAWGSQSDAGKRQVWLQIEQRKNSVASDKAAG